MDLIDVARRPQDNSLTRNWAGGGSVTCAAPPKIGAWDAIKGVLRGKSNGHRKSDAYPLIMPKYQQDLLQKAFYWLERIKPSIGSKPLKTHSFFLTLPLNWQIKGACLGPRSQIYGFWTLISQEMTSMGWETSHNQVSWDRQDWEGLDEKKLFIINYLFENKL